MVTFLVTFPCGARVHSIPVGVSLTFVISTSPRREYSTCSSIVCHLSFSIFINFL